MMSYKNLFKSRTTKTGKAPGSLIYIGDHKVENPKIKIIDYDANNYKELSSVDCSECLEFTKKDSVTWIDVEGINTEIVEKMGKMLNLHPLVTEDILNTDQRAKIEVYDKYAYVVLKMIYKGKSKHFISEQISIILTSNYIVTFQEGYEGDNFNHVRERLRTEAGKIRKMQTDYLLYSLIDSIVDAYFVVLEDIGDRIENMEELLIKEESDNILYNINHLKKEMIMLRKSVWPLREVLNKIEKEDIQSINDSSRLYFRDVYDHTIHVIDTIETYRDLLSSLMDIYLTNISNKTNQIVKILTIITTIFIPLTFIAGIYGMNFDTRYKWNMPELRWEYGYPFIILIMIIVAVSLIIYFKNKKWI